MADGGTREGRERERAREGSAFALVEGLHLFAWLGLAQVVDFCTCQLVRWLVAVPFTKIRMVRPPLKTTNTYCTNSYDFRKKSGEAATNSYDFKKKSGEVLMNS